jgi:ubiquinone/menaquinone biosynthesis C-methylase UbiE
VNEETAMSQPVSYKSFPGTAAENYERYFLPVIGGPIAAALVEAAAIRRGQRVLDIACGTGVVARLAADRVGQAGTVTGVDLTPGMLAVAKTVAAGSRIDWHHASAEKLPLADASVDVALCSLGLQFFPDRVAALREMRRVLIPGGRAAFNAVGPTPPLFMAMHDALGEHVGAAAAAFVATVFSFNDADQVRQLLAETGFNDIEVASTMMKLQLPPPMDFLWQYIHCTPLAAAAADLTAERRAALEGDVRQAWQPFVTEDGMLLELDIAIATAHA